MTNVDTAAVLAGLKQFQRDAVDHVINRFYETTASERSNRFLIADETGLGKSIVARGVIARTIAHLESVDDVERIDIIYVCSNLDLARQNLRRLNVTGNADISLSSRLTLLAKDSRKLNAPQPGSGKKVNLVSFTPATSFDMRGSSAGNAEERALMALILRELIQMTPAQWKATRLLLKRMVRDLDRFTGVINRLDAQIGRQIDPEIVRVFGTQIEGRITDRFLGLLDGMRYKREVPKELKTEMWQVLGEMRRALAMASLNSLEPDLIILDEFQRFRDLLLPPDRSPAAELANALFSHDAARVLLLSATPYKPFTGSDEIGEDHYRDFLQTVDFLTNRDELAKRNVRNALEHYRAELVSGRDGIEAAHDVRAALLPYMTRSERPQLTGGFRVRSMNVAVPGAADLQEYAQLRQFGDEIGAPVSLEYWKSIPYFANFMDGYKPGERARARFGTPEGVRSQAMLAAVRSISRKTIEEYAPLDAGNGYLRALMSETVGNGWWRLLWMPPSMPYLEPGRVYSRIGDMTKRVIFSAWSGVPTAVSSLISYAADQNIAAASNGYLSENTSIARRSMSDRLSYRTVEGEVGALSTIALFWPHPELAKRGDPLAFARRAGGRVTAGDAERSITTEIGEGSPASHVWDAFYSWPGAFPSGERVRDLVSAAMDPMQGPNSEASETILMRHVDAALKRISESSEPLVHPDLARLAAHSPGAIAWRALRSIADEGVTERGLWIAAFRLADSIRRLFNRPESIAVLEGTYGDASSYWSAVLDYCADGNLQSVLDEYCFQLRSEQGGREIDDRRLLEIATECTHVLNLRPARYEAHDTSAARSPIGFNARFGLRYGGRFANMAEGAAGHRLSEVRAAFNSPFAPFVLISTSVGQEGIDFHWWSHAVVHWNLPSNPVDFEQREGRVNRFAGHAIRKNVAAAHFDEVLTGNDLSPWRAAFSAAVRASEANADQLGEYAPWWVYPGPAAIERIVPHYPLSRDIDRYDRLRDALALYRLTLGQPRQEDMVSLLSQAGVDGSKAPPIDLRPPRSPAT